MRLDGVEEADELLVPVALHIAADDGAVEDIGRGFARLSLVGRMDDVSASPIDIFGFVWFFAIGGIKLNLPWFDKLKSRRRPRGGSNRVFYHF